MIKRLTYIIILIFINRLSVFSQGCVVPEPPVLKLVTVQPESGKIDFSWDLSPSAGIAAYIVYTYNNGDGFPVDTIWDPSATTYTLTDYAIITKVNRYMSESFVIAAHRLSVVPGLPGCTSIFSNVISTVFCKPSLNECSGNLTVNWNLYPEVTGHSILVSENNGPLTERYSAPATSTSFTITGIVPGTDYCLVVRSLLANGTFSNSNKNCIKANLQKAPEWINADYATVTDNADISLSFTIEQSSEISRYVIQRRTGFSGSFDSLARVAPLNWKAGFTDITADITKPNFYRLAAFAGNCKNPVLVSNLSSNIVLTLNESADDLDLRWNAYRDWKGEISSYDIYMNKGTGFELKVAGLTDTAYILNIKDIMYSLTTGEACFLVRAAEGSNPYGIAGESLSSRVCITSSEIITVPNTFTPNNDQINDYFRPILSFTPSAYHLIITSRNGRLLFETTDHLESWDGLAGGDPVQQGVCIWYLELITPSGQKISKTGTITIYRGR